MLPPGKLIKHALPMEARKKNCAPNVVAETLLSADCLRGAFGAGDSSRRSGTLDAALQEGRDESRPGRQECLRHIGTADNVKLFLRGSLVHRFMNTVAYFVRPARSGRIRYRTYE